MQYERDESLRGNRREANPLVADKGKWRREKQGTAPV